MAIQTSAATRSFWARPLYLIAAFVVVLVIAAGAVLALHRYSEEEYSRAVESNELGLTTYHYFISMWRLTQSYFPQPNALPEAIQAEQEEALLILEDARERYLAEASQNEPSSARADLIAVGTNVDDAYELILAGRPEEALPIMFQANAHYYVAAESVYQASGNYQNQAERAASIARFASLGVFGSTIAGMGGVFLLYRRAQNKSEHAYAEQEILRRSEARFRPLIQSATDVITVTDESGIIKYISPSITRHTNVPQEELIGKSMTNFVKEEDVRHMRNLISEVSSRPGYMQWAEMQSQSNLDPEITRHVQISCTNQLEDPDVGGLIFNIRDISERKALEEQLRHQAFHDSLTGLANRLRFTDRLEYALERGKRSSGKLVSVLYLDLDYFKNVNDDMGHTAGDELLNQIAERIRRCIRSTDTAARLGGDEFAVLLEDHHTADEARAVADCILEQIKQPFTIQNRDVHVSASIGVVAADPHNDSADEIIRDADVAMYDAKENGRGRVQVFEPSMQLSLAERAALSNDLNGSTQRNELEVYYQPTLNLENGEIVGFEALVRWNHPKRGLLAPTQFIPLAEESGFIQELGHYVLQESCRQGREWQTKYPDGGNFVISVNVSARQIQKQGFVDEVRQILKETGFPAASLVLEITETVLIRHPQQVIRTLAELKGLGLQLALDDFGTGYSSLSYLKRFPIDILKIDRAFIESMDESDRDKMLVQTVIDLGHTLKLNIVAEGIERQTQLESLQQLHCALGQGFLFAKALDAASAEVMLQKQAATNTASAASNNQSERVA